MITSIWRNLQLFAEGGDGATGGEGEGSAATVVASSGDDGQQKLRDLGVPEDILMRHMARRSRGSAQSGAAPQQQAQPQDQQDTVPPAQEEHPVEDQQESTSQEDEPRLADLAKKYPSINKDMQAIVQNRLKGNKGSAQALEQLAPLLTMVADGYGLEIDPENPDYKPLIDAYMHDPDRYQDMALERGITSQEAMDETLREMQQKEWDAHFDALDQQAQEFQKIVPGFDLRAEMQNDVFARATAPGGMTVEQAYYGLHHAEMQQALAQATARNTRSKVAAAIQSGSMRPAETGTSSQAPSTTHFDYSNASKAQREAFKAELRRAWNRGETVYPGQNR